MPPKKLYSSPFIHLEYISPTNYTVYSIITDINKNNLIYNTSYSWTCVDRQCTNL